MRRRLNPRTRMKTQYCTASSLDGFIATDDHSLEWLFQLGDVNDTGCQDFIRDVGALAMGSSTCEWMPRHVVKPAAGPGRAWPYAQPTWVFSSRRRDASWASCACSRRWPSSRIRSAPSNAVT